MSMHSLPGGEGAALPSLLDRLRGKASQTCGTGSVTTVVIQEAGLDGFSGHRLLEANGIESHGGFAEGSAKLFLNTG